MPLLPSRNIDFEDLLPHVPTSGTEYKAILAAQDPKNWPAKCKCNICAPPDLEPIIKAVKALPGFRQDTSGTASGVRTATPDRRTATPELEDDDNGEMAEVEVEEDEEHEERETGGSSKGTVKTTGPRPRKRSTAVAEHTERPVSSKRLRSDAAREQEEAKEKALEALVAQRKAKGKGKGKGREKETDPAPSGGKRGISEVEDNSDEEDDRALLPTKRPAKQPRTLMEGIDVPRFARSTPNRPPGPVVPPTPSSPSPARSVEPPTLHDIHAEQTKKKANSASAPTHTAGPSTHTAEDMREDISGTVTIPGQKDRLRSASVETNASSAVGTAGTAIGQSALAATVARLNAMMTAGREVSIAAMKAHYSRTFPAFPPCTAKESTLLTAGWTSNLEEACTLPIHPEIVLHRGKAWLEIPDLLLNISDYYLFGLLSGFLFAYLHQYHPDFRSSKTRTAEMTTIYDLGKVLFAQRREHMETVCGTDQDMLLSSVWDTWTWGHGYYTAKAFVTGGHASEGDSTLR